MVAVKAKPRRMSPRDRDAWQAFAGRALAPRAPKSDGAQVVPPPESAPTGRLERHEPCADDVQLRKLWIALAAGRRGGSGDATRRGYASDLEWWRRRLGGALDVRRLRLADVVGAMEGDASKPATRARRLATLRSLVGFAQRIGFVPVNVLAAVPAPRRANDLAERILEPEQVIALAHAAKGGRLGERDHMLVRVLYVGGLRVAEAIGLDWEHVHKRDDGTTLTIHGKGGKSRHVPITAATARVLEARRVSQGPVFRSRTGERLTERDARRAVARAARAAGLPRNVSPHWLRHSHATHALHAGATIDVVAATLGHGSIGTTARYVHARPGVSSAQWLTL